MGTHQAGRPTIELPPTLQLTCVSCGISLYVPDEVPLDAIAGRRLVCIPCYRRHSQSTGPSLADDGFTEHPPAAGRPRPKIEIPDDGMTIDVEPTKERGK